MYNGLRPKGGTVDLSTVITWTVCGGLSAASQFWLCHKIEARPTVLGLICFTIAFHFWPLWYFRKYRPAKAAYELAQYQAVYGRTWLERERAQI